MRNQHLIPANVIDLVGRINNESTNVNERNNLIHRLEVIKEYTDQEYNKVKKKYL
jgi:hypothetical protein